MTAERIDLEIKFAQLEHTVDALNGELQQHRQAIERLQEQMRHVLEQLRQKQPDADIGPHDSPPPHYHAG